MQTNLFHSGSGDIVAGNKIINNYNSAPKLEYQLSSKNKTLNGYEYIYNVEITPPGKDVSTIVNSIVAHPVIASIRQEVLSVALTQSGNHSAVQLRLISPNRIVDNEILFTLR